VPFCDRGDAVHDAVATVSDDDDEVVGVELGHGGEDVP
jgi:hypothetical protein